MPSLEQIIRPFVVNDIRPPDERRTASQRPPAKPVRLNIGLGQTNPSTLNAQVAATWPNVHSYKGKTVQSFNYRSRSK